MDKESKEYKEYLNSQASGARRTVGRTRKKRIRYEWILNQVLEIEAKIKTVLCVGARDKFEVEYFKDLGYDAIGVDIFDTEGLIKCDMSEMDKHPELRDRNFDLILLSDSMEHCLDMKGLKRALNNLSAGYIAVTLPNLRAVEGWDINILPFMGHEYKTGCLPKKAQKMIEREFRGYDVVIADYHKRIDKIFFVLRKWPEITKPSTWNWAKYVPSDLDFVPKTNYRISLCTTVMNRLEEISETLPINLANTNYENSEFVILDYNSSDGLEDWIKANYMEEIESGRLRYARTTEPQHFQMGHSRNLAFQVATGDIVNNVDADNFIGENFQETLNMLANKIPERAIFAKSRQRMHGRIGFFKKDWIELRGYDEELKGYGWDDKSLVYRALHGGFTFVPWSQFGTFTDRIWTGDARRMENMEMDDRKQNEFINQNKLMGKILANDFTANPGTWGVGTVEINFEKKITLGQS
jgi:hypothetical protein